MPRKKAPAPPVPNKKPKGGSAGGAGKPEAKSSPKPKGRLASESDKPKAKSSPKPIAGRHKPQPDDRTTIAVARQDATNAAKARQSSPAKARKADPASIAIPKTKTVNPGDILNDIFEVRRLIGRGGMGEVFEGINISSEEPVAIKVILPHLAQNPKVLAMFRREALLLTRLSHPAIVQYRVLAHEPRLGVFYIVTDFIGGESLSHAVDHLEPSPADLVALIRRLAQGLDAAHRLGVIHRDISPDNIMLPDGRLEHARIIDFGIAKDLGSGSATIVGDGFAGKLKYVAPEQLGEFDRSVGPWTDVYGLALTILAVARRESLDLGGSMVDAVDKRRKGIDVTAAPPELREVLRKMLCHDPRDRFRTMEDVITALDRLGRVSDRPMKAAKQIGGAAGLGGVDWHRQESIVVDPPGGAPRDLRAWTAALDRTLLRFGVNSTNLTIVAGAVLLALAGLYWVNDNGSTGEANASGETRTAPQPVVLSPEAQVVRARNSIEALLPSLACTWLNLAGVTIEGDRVALSVEGISGTSAAADSARGKIEQALRGAGLVPGRIGFDGVTTVNVADCQPIDTFKKFGNPGGSHRITGKTTWEFHKLGKDAREYEGLQGALVLAEANLSGVSQPAHIMFLEKNRLFLVDAPISERYPAIGKVRYRLNGVTDEKGWSAIVLLIGKGPFDRYVLDGNLGAKRDWSDRFSQVASARGWTVEMHWFRVVDDIAD